MAVAEAVGGKARYYGEIPNTGRVYTGKSKWTQAHWRWLERVKFELAVQQIVLEEYVDAVKQAQARVAGLEEEMRQALAGFIWAIACEVMGRPVMAR